jgi:hypothetical protein
MHVIADQTETRQRIVDFHINFCLYVSIALKKEIEFVKEICIIYYV